MLRYYGDDSQNNQLETVLNITINGKTEVLSLVKATEHYFTLTLRVSSTLQIEEYFVYSTRICATITQGKHARHMYAYVRTIDPCLHETKSYHNQRV